MNPPAVTAPQSVRRRGLIRFSFGLLVFVPIVLLVVFLSQHVSSVVIPIALTLPGVYALSGLVEFATGISFSELARRWDDLKGWQRGIFGTFIVLVAGLVIVSVVGLFAAYL